MNIGIPLTSDNTFFNYQESTNLTFIGNPINQSDEMDTVR